MTVTKPFAKSLDYALVLLLVSVFQSACTSDDSVIAPPAENLNRVWDVESNISSINMVPGDEFLITLSPKDINGNIKPLDGTVSHISEHPDVVAVDSNGRLRALGVTGPIRVFSSFTSEGVTFTDTISVTVLASPVDIESVKITSSNGSPLNPIINYQSYSFFALTVKDRDGFSVNGLVYSVKSLDNSIVGVWTYHMYGNDVGKTKVIAEVNAFGRSFVDTAEISVLFPSAASLSISSFMTNPIIGANGVVTFSNYWSPRRDIRIVFDKNNPNSPDPAGDTLIVPSFMSVQRTFNSPGIYNFVVSDTTIKGSIIVRENPTFQTLK